MSVIERLWFATITRRGRFAGTDSAIGLVVNTNGVDRLNRFIRLSTQRDWEPGQANLHELDVTGARIDTDELNSSSLRVSILGSDDWAPEFVFIWGEKPQTKLFDPDIEPMGMETSLETLLAIPKSPVAIRDGIMPTMPIRLIAAGVGDTQITRVMVLITTSGHLASDDRIEVSADGIGKEFHPGAHGTGTNDPVELEINAGGLAVRAELPLGPQLDLEAGQANIYFLPTILPFTRAALQSDSITLRIKGRDAWLPQSFFLFGLGDSERPDSVVPLVHIPEWDFGKMSTDDSEGEDLITLPILGADEAQPGGGIFGG